MLSPICQNAWTKLNPGSAVCDLLKNLLLIQEKLFTFWGWMFTDTNDGCILSEDFVRQTLTMLQPIGTVLWAPKNLALNSFEWLACDGEEYLKDDYKALADLFGNTFGTPSDPKKFKVPNLQGRVALQAGQRVQTLPDGFSPQFDVGETGGDDESQWAYDAIIDHRHPFGVMESVRNDDSTWPESETFPDSGALNSTVPITAAVDVPVPFSGLVFDAASVGSLNIMAGNLKKANFITSEGMTNKFPDPESNWPPYFSGIYYIKANYIYNGKVL